MTLGRPLHWLYPLAGIVLSIGTVSGLVVFRGLHEGAVLSFAWLVSELHSQAGTYLYLTVFTAALFVTLGMILGRKEELLFRSSITDPATQLSNRRYFEERLPKELASARHEGRALSLL